MSNQHMIRALVRGAYDEQKLRIENGNRLCANFRAKLGLDPNEAPEEKPKILEDLERRFKLITDGVVEVTRRRKYQYDGVISDYTELCLVYQYVDLMGREKKHFRQMAGIIEEHPLWDAFFKGVRGCGPAMSGVILSEIDIHKATYASSLWKYAGLDVGSDGRGRSRRAEHLVEVAYEAADGTQKTRKSITFNPFLKTKLCGVLSGSILRAGDSPLRDVYDGYKWRIEERLPAWTLIWTSIKERGKTVMPPRMSYLFAAKKVGLYQISLHNDPRPGLREIDFPVGKGTVHLAGKGGIVMLERKGDEMILTIGDVVGRYAKGTTRGHRHNMALRYMIKRFLAELYVAWRTLENLEVHAPYSEAKLKMKPHGE